MNAITAIENCRMDDMFYPTPGAPNQLIWLVVLQRQDRQTRGNAKLNNRHATSMTCCSLKMDQAAEEFCWPGLHREIRAKSECCPSCRTAGTNLRTQIPRMELNKLELSSEPNQELQMDFAGPIKSRTRGDVYILVAVDRFSKWPTAHICENTDTWTVLKFLTEYCSDNRTPRKIRSDNGSCFKNKEFKEFCDGEHIERTDARLTYTPVPVWCREI